MNKENKFLVLIFFAVLICSLTTSVYAQTNNTFNTPLTQEDMVNEAQNDVDRSLNILNMVATLIGVLVGILAIIVAIAAASGLINRIAGKKYKEEAEKSLNEVKKIAAEAIPIFEGLKNMEKDVKNLRNKIMHQTFEKPSEELKKEVDASEKNIRLRESF